MRSLKLFFTVIIITIGINMMHAQDNQLEVGDKMPQFEAVADNGETWKSENIVGKKNPAYWRTYVENHRLFLQKIKSRS